jgi:hypothetical protein
MYIYIYIYINVLFKTLPISHKLALFDSVINNFWKGTTARMPNVIEV